MTLKQSRRMLWWIAAAFSTGVMLLAIAGLVAALSAFRARSFIEAWENQTTLSIQANKYYEPSEADWQSAKNNATRAVTLFSLSPDYQELVGRIYAFRYPMRGIGDKEAMPFWQQSSAYYRKAIQLRPTWPHTYMALAGTLRQQDLLGDEYLWSMQQALHYGPWEPNVLMMIVGLNLDILPRLSPQARDVVVNTALRTLNWTHDQAGNAIPYGKELWKQVIAHRRQYVLCAWLPTKDPTIKALCSPDEAAKP